MYTTKGGHGVCNAFENMGLLHSFWYENMEMLLNFRAPKTWVSCTGFYPRQRGW